MDVAHVTGALALAALIVLVFLKRAFASVKVG